MSGIWVAPSRILLVGLALIGVTFAPAGQPSITKVRVASQSANIRSKPDLAAPILKVVTAGTVFESQGKEGRWYQVSLPPNAEGAPVFGFLFDSLAEILEENPAVPPAVKAPVSPNTGGLPTEKSPPESASPLPSSGKRSLSFRPYGKIGFLLTPPSATDLGFINADGEDTDQYLDVSSFGFGGGIQILYSMKPGNTMSFGLDIGAQKLFSSVFDLGSGGVVYSDIHNENEFSFHLLGFVEFRSRQSPLFFQTGLGLHFVSWYWEYAYNGKYHDEYEEESGLEAALGVLLAGGFDIPLSENISMPVIARLDGLMRYGMMLSFSLSFGLTFR